MDVQRSLIGELMPYEFEMGYKPTEATKNMLCYGLRNFALVERNSTIR